MGLLCVYLCNLFAIFYSYLIVGVEPFFLKIQPANRNIYFATILTFSN